ncbi:MAG: Ig-like domain-containing protein [Luteolibacter sp.]
MRLICEGVSRIGVLLFVALPFAQAGVTDAVVTKNPPNLNQGWVKGSVRVMTGGQMNLNSGLTIDGKLILSGTPDIRVNGGAVSPVIQNRTGSALPAGYRVTINNSVIFGSGIRQKVDPEILPAAVAPAVGSGTRLVHINQLADSPGNFATIRTLTINAQGGNVNLPPGRYERITLNGASTLNLQAGTTSAPALFEIQQIDVNGGSHVIVQGPVTLRLKNSLNLNGYLGASAHPEWLDMSISNGSLTLNSQSAFHGKAVVPAGTLTVNGNSLLHGLAFTDRLTLNGNGIIECEGSGGTPNLPPVATAGETSTAIATAVGIPLVASDPENSPLTYQITTPPTNGSVTLAGAVATYTPNAGFTGNDTFFFKASDGTLDSAPAAFVIHVFQPNRAPLATSPVFVVNQGEANAPVVLSASDPDDDAITYQIATQPALGTISGNPPTLTYSHTGPRSTAVVEDTFTYTATDSKGAVSAIASVKFQLQPVNRPPTASPLTPNGNEDSVITISLTGEDPDGDVLAYEIVTDPANPSATPGPLHGTLSGVAPQLTYQPAANFHGMDRFHFCVKDAVLSSAVAEVSITVLPVNDGPVAVAKSLTGPEDGAINIAFDASDVDGDALIYTTTLPDGFPGTVIVTGASALFTPDTDFNGAAGFSYTATDSSGGSATAVVSLQVTPVNDAPVVTANPAPLTLAEDGSLTFIPVGSDSDGDALTFEITAHPGHGTLTANPDGSYLYTPAENFNGTDSFAYIARDADSSSAPVTVGISVTSRDDAPLAYAASHTLAEDGSIEVTLTGLDVDGDPLVFEIVSQPQHGLITGNLPNLTYTPTGNFNGEDSLEFTIRAGEAESAIATIFFITTPVNDAPVAVAASLATDEDSILPVVLAATDIENDAIAYEVTVQPQHGSLSGVAPNFTYMPVANYNGPDSFSYVAKDATATSFPAVVSLTIRPINDLPLAQNLTTTTDEDTAVPIHLATTDADDAEHAYSVIMPPTHGTLTGTAPHFVYTPAPNFHGSDTFTYTASDAAATSAPAIVTISVVPQNDEPVAVAANYSLNEDTTISINLSGLDPDGDAITFQIVTQTSHGALTGIAPTLTYTPLANFNGAESFSFIVKDAFTSSSAATISLAVNPVDDAPLAGNVETSVLEDSSVTVNLLGTVPNGASITYAVLTQPAHGTLAGTAPALTYTPEPNYNGSDSFTYKVHDGTTDSPPATASITVTPVNDQPVAGSASYTVRQRENLSFTLTGSSVDGDELYYEVTDQPDNSGTLSGSSPTFVYTPDLYFTGTETIRVTAISLRSGLASAPADITFEVTSNNLPPIAEELNVTIDTLPVDIVLPASDPENLPLHYYVDFNESPDLTITGTPPNLRLTRQAPGARTTSFEYYVEDDLGLYTTARVSVKLLGPNRNPSINSSLFFFKEDDTAAFTLVASDPDQDRLTYSWDLPAGSPCMIEGAGPDFILRFSPNFSGTTVATARVTDGRGGVANRDMTFLVSEVNDAPVTTLGNNTTGEDTPLNLSISVMDPEDSPVTYTLVSPPLHGSLAGTLPNLSYIPQENFNGVDSFVFSVGDGSLLASVTVPITVTTVNDPPAAERVTEKFTGLTTAFVLRGADADGDTLTYRLLIPPSIGSASVSGNLLTFAATGPFLGNLHFSYVANDGLVDSAPAPIVLTGGVAPEARILSPMAGARLPMGESIPVKVDASDADGGIIRYELFANGASVATSTTADIAWTPSQNGPVALTIKVTDDAGLTFNSAPLHLTITGENQAPVVFAGSDRDVFPLTFGPNLVTNGSCELPLDGNGNVPFWSKVDGFQDLTKDDATTNTGAAAGFSAFPMAADGSSYFGPRNPNNYSFEQKTAKLTQVVDLDSANSSDQSQYVFKARFYCYRGQFNYYDINDELREPRVELQFLNAGGDVIATRTVRSKTPVGMWYPVCVLLDKPQQAASLRITLTGHREPNAVYYYHSLIDDVSVRATLSSEPLTLHATVSDDGLPATGSRSQSWTQIEGPPASLTAPESADTQVGFTGIGKHVFKLTATDGELSSSDTIEINVGSASDGNAPPRISLASQMTVTVGTAAQPLVATVTDDGNPGDTIYHYWEQVSGPSEASFADPRAAATTFNVSVPGAYTFRLTSHDGSIAATAEIAIQANCELTRQPIDLYIITDHSGSMFGPEAGIITDYDPRTPVYQARKLVNTLLGSLDPALDRVSINKNDSASYNQAMPYTSDFEAARQHIIRPQGEFIFEGYDSYVLPAIARCVNFVRTNARADAKKIILHLNDGVAGPSEINPQTLAGYGITAISVSMPNMKNDPINRQEISRNVSTPAHAFFVTSLSDPAVVDGFFKIAFSSLCRGFNTPPMVHAGDAVYLPAVASVFQPAATVSDEQGIEMLSLAWEQVSGPASAQIETPNLLRPLIRFTQPGSYLFKLSAMDGSSTSSDTVLVKVGTTSSKPTPAGMIAYWPFDGSMRDIIGSRTLAPRFPHMPPAFVNDSKAEQALNLAGRTFPFNQTDGPLFDLKGAASGMAVSLWFKTPAAAGSGTLLQFAGYSTSADGRPYWPSPGLGLTYDALWKRINVSYELANGNSTSDPSIPVFGTLVPDVWNHLVVNYDNVANQLLIYTNGILTNTRTLQAGMAPVFARNGQGLTIGSAQYDSGKIDWSNAPSSPGYGGVVDELAIFNRTLTLADIDNLANRNSGLTPPALNPPPIVNAGRDQLVFLAQPVSLLEGLVTDDDPELNSLWSLQAGPADGCQFSNPELTNSLVTFSKAGVYTFELKADDGYQIVTDTMEIRVDQACQSPLPANALLWLKADGDPRDAIAKNDLKWFNQPGYVDGKAGKAFEFNGSNGILESGALDFGGATELTFEGWFRDNAGSQSSKSLFEISAGGQVQDPLALQAVSTISSNGIRYISFNGAFRDAGGVPRQNSFLGTASFATSSYPLGEFYHLAISISRANGVSFYVNGIRTANAAVPSNLVSLYIPPAPILRLGGRNNGQDRPKVAIDEFSMYSRILDASEVLSIYQAGSAGKCPPWAQSPLNSGYVDAGQSVTLPEHASLAFAGTYEADDFAANPAFSWSLVEGPAPVALSGEDTLTPGAAFTVAGRYLFELAVTDGVKSGSDTVIVDLLRTQNTAPVITWTPPASLQLPQDTLILAPMVTDDGLPNNLTRSSWRMVSGPALVNFADLTDTANAHDVEARFTAPGSYELEFIASDDLLTATRRCIITVLAEAAPPSSNFAPMFSLGTDIVAVAKTIVLFPTVLDDGKPSGSITANWDYDRGPGAPRFDLPANATGPEASITFPLPGIYEIRLTVSDGELSSFDTVSVEVPASLFGPGEGLNAAPLLASMAPQVVIRPATEITLQPAFTDADGPAASYGYAWEQVSGPAPLGLSNTTSLSQTIAFAELGTYVVKFTLTDGPYIRSNYITLHHLAAPNAPPTLNLSPPGGTASPMSTVTLAANASDDGIPGVLIYEWDWLSSPSAGAPVFSDATASETRVTFPAAGDYVLYCRVSDGQLSKHQTISYRVLGEPFFAILSPQDGGVVSDQNIPEVQIRAFQEGGSVSSVTLALDGTNLGQAHLEKDTVDYFLDLPSMIRGNHSLTATATFADGTVLTRTSSFQLADYAEEALVLEIDSPHEATADIIAPTPVIGTVKSPQLKDYKLEIAPLDSPLSKKVIATGTSQVTSATLGTIDPTLLENGLYTLTLSGTTTTGLYASTSEQVLIDGNMKLGQFSLAFEDLSIDLPGTPLAITRTYDSRDVKGGDFGPGWSLATSSVKVRKTRPLNTGWEQTRQGGGFVTSWLFQVQPTQRKRVIVSFPGGRTEIFETGIRAAVPYTADQSFAQRYTPIYGASYTFMPVGAAQGKLEVDGETEILWAGEGNDFANIPSIEGQFASYDETASNPTRFRYTEPGGASYIIDETQGLMSIADTNGNIVTISRSGIHHSAGESVLFTRNAAGRITEINDGTGKKLTYLYDGNGRLNTFTNRANQSNRYAYGVAAFPHYLTDIYDGTNVRAIRTAYDADGRMISQTDANGKTIGFTHEVSQRRESITDRLGDITTHEFDENGNVTRTTDALGGVTNRGYDANDNETSTTTPLGFTTSRAFDAKNNLLSEADPLGHASRYSYDGEKRPLSISDALDHSTVITYSSNGNLTRMVDPGGTPTDFSYSGSGEISTLTDTNGTTTSYTHDAKGHEKTTRVTTADGTLLSSEAYDYDDSGNRIRSISSDGARYFTTTYTYDAENRLTRTTYPDGASSATVYNANGKVAYESDTAGYTTYYTYDSRGNLIQTDHPGINRITRSGFDAEGRMTSSTDMAGATTYTLYDALGRATATIEPDTTMPATILTEVADIAAAPALADNPRTVTTYDADGRVTASTDALGNSTTFEYDDAGRRTAVIDALGHRMSYSYDAAGRQTSSTDAKGNVTTFTYDAAGRLTRTDLPDGNHTITGYDTLGRRISSTDAEGNVTLFAYDPQGRLIAVTDALGAVTRYAYDQRGLQIAQTDALNHVTTYEYDSMGRRSARILPQGQREEMTYNSLGQLTAHKDFNGQTVTRTYELYTQNLLSIVAPYNHPSLTLSHAPARYDFAYDILGRRTGSTVKNRLGSVLSSETFSYDVRSQLTGYTGPNGSIGYGYDVAGNLAGAKSGTAGGYDVSYDYDAQNRLTMVHRGQQGIDPNATQLAAYNYDANGNLNGVGYANGVQHAYTYNALNRLTALSVSSVPPSAIPNPRALQGYSYQLNKNGHRTQISELSGRAVTHTFDALNRLTAESITRSAGVSPTSPATPTGTLSYSYDSVGNRTSRSSTGPIAQILPYQGVSFNANDRLTSEVSYDANGNTQFSKDNTSAPSYDTYSFDNRLIRRTHANGISSYSDIVVDITYNADGHRLTKLISENGLTRMALT